jgi:hypothetical protein
MAIVRDIITHVEVEVALKARICHHNRRDHGITKGQKCLAIHSPDGGRKNYCLPCAMDILVKARTKLQAMEIQIQS